MSGYELTYPGSRNMIQFSFFTIVFPPIQNVTIPKCKFYFVNRKTITKPFLAVTVKIDFQYAYHLFTKAVLLLLYVHVNCFDTRFFPLIYTGVSTFIITNIQFFFFIDITFILTRFSWDFYF